MLPGIPPEIQEAMDLGISIFAGEAEGRLGELLQDAQRGSLKPIYDWMKELPSLEGAPIPFLPRKIKSLVLGFYGSQAIEGIHPLQGGFVRLKHRTDRRPGLPIANPLLFYPAYIWETVSKALRFFWLNRTYNRILERVEKRTSTASYTDLALRPASDDDLDQLGLFSITESAKEAADHVRGNAKLRIPQPAE